LQLWNYDKNRKIFLEEYKADMENDRKHKSLLEFSDIFFEEEEREEFLVEADMKLAWAGEMEVLAVIDKICRENGIKYFADYGTLLGAVRHKGFIPWDDDMDICMLREDYQRFYEIASKGLPSNCLLKSCYLDPKWTYPYMRVINSAGLPINKEQMEKFHGCPYVVGVDIFPIDNIPQEQAEIDVLITAYSGLAGIAELMKQGKTKAEMEEDIKKVEDYLKIKFDREGNIINQVYLMLDKIATIYQGENCKEVACIIFWAGQAEKARLKECYKESTRLPFENMQLPVPIGYEEVLKTLYGDWKKRVRFTAFHDYPFYKSQREFLEEKGYLKRQEKDIEGK